MGNEYKENLRTNLSIIGQIKGKRLERQVVDRMARSAGNIGGDRVPLLGSRLYNYCFILIPFSSFSAKYCDPLENLRPIQRAALALLLDKWTCMFEFLVPQIFRRNITLPDFFHPLPIRSVESKYHEFLCN